MEGRIQRDNVLSIIPFLKAPLSMRFSILKEFFFGTEIWSICVTLFSQDILYLAIRLIVLLKYQTFNSALIFYLLKNLLMTFVQGYRLFEQVISFLLERNLRQLKFKAYCRIHFMNIKQYGKSTIKEFQDETASLRDLYHRYNLAMPKITGNGIE
ncbi:hypothetical protein GJ496_005889 [Pomphorhynchus laevis]|nr:hypothetical protein GJ496_005889 [Pomphorhynchus laevis]